MRSPQASPAQFVSVTLADNVGRCRVVSRYDPLLTPRKFVPLLREYGGTWDKARRAWYVHTLVVSDLAAEIEDAGFVVAVDGAVDGTIEQFEDLLYIKIGRRSKHG